MSWFVEKHRTVLNQVLRQSGNGLSDGLFSILIQMPKLLDFDVKRKYFRKQMQRLDGPVRFEYILISVHFFLGHVFLISMLPRIRSLEHHIERCKAGLRGCRLNGLLLLRYGGDKYRSL